MLFWVASFPRSGSALTRTILWQCFGVHVNNTGRERIRVTVPVMDPFVGPRAFPPGTSAETMAEHASESSDPLLIKTHALPGDLPVKAPAIVIVRDGRPVMTSFARFQTEVAGRETSMAQVIAGRRSWSDHVNAWLDHDGSKLLLRYEDLRIAKQETLDAIAAFIGKPQIAPFTATVEEIRAVRPSHIQVARDEPGIEEIERDHAEAFWSRHGAAMARLGYER